MKHPFNIFFNVFFCLATLSITTLDAGDMQEAFLKANAAYEAGDPKTALQLYESMRMKGPAVHYGMGNCYFFEGRYPEAVVAWRRAQNGCAWSEYPQLEASIMRAYHEYGKSHDDSLWTRARAFITRLVIMPSLFAWQMLFLFMWFLLIFCAPYLVKRSSYGVLVCLVCATGMSAGSCALIYRLKTYHRAIVIKKSIFLYAGPDRSYARIATVNGLDEAHVQSVRDGWFKIRMSSHGSGWVAADDVALVVL